LPRPKLEETVGNAVRSYLRAAETQSAEGAPLNTQAVARQVGFNRKTLKKYGLDAEIAAAAEKQRHNGKMSARKSELRRHADAVHEHESEVESMRRRCEALVGKVSLAEGNAQRLGIDPIELWKPLSVPDRTLPHTGRRIG
jgi:hypothetical protein